VFDTVMGESRSELATLIDQVSNRLQVVLGYAQILHELDTHERADAVRSIARECDQLKSMLGTLTTVARAADGTGPWHLDKAPVTPR
jgi:hypothetical protein